MPQKWHKVAEVDDLPAGQVTTVTAGVTAVCLIHTAAHGYTALDNRCPHQGGPLGEGQLDGQWLICPWHGYEYHPQTGHLTIDIHLSAQINVTAVMARRKVNAFLATHLGNLLLAAEPVLTIADRIIWRVPVDLTALPQGRLGWVGEQVEFGPLTLPLIYKKDKNNP